MRLGGRSERVGEGKGQVSIVRPDEARGLVERLNPFMVALHTRFGDKVLGIRVILQFEIDRSFRRVQH